MRVGVYIPQIGQRLLTASLLVTGQNLAAGCQPVMEASQLLLTALSAVTRPVIGPVEFTAAME